MAADLLRERLPAHLSIGVTRDGRVFFVDDRIQTTSWLHPRTGQPVKTGHRQIQGAQGWEQAVTPEGAIYYIDHNTQITTFEHPVTRKPSNHASNKTSSSSSPPRTPTSPTSPQSNRKVATPTKVKSLKAPPAKREETNMVAMKGWLYRQESGFKSWKKRWCVLADFGLFFYKDDEEKNQIGSILLPSYKIGQCLPGESSKKYAFKAEHSNMKTYMFASDNQENMDMWISLLKSAAMLRGPSITEKEPNNNSPQKLVPKSAFMEWDEDEGSPMSKKFWTEGPDVGSPHERKQRPPENRSPDYNRSPPNQIGTYSNNRQHEPRTPDDPHFRDDKRSPSSPSSRPKIPIDKNMPKGITYDPFHGYRNDPRNNKVQEQEKASPRERYNERHREPKQKGHRHQENDSRQRYPSDDSRQNDPRPGYPSNESRQNDPRQQYPNDVRQNDPRQHYPNDPRQQYPNDPRQQYPNDVRQSDPRQQYLNDNRQNDPRQRDPSDDSPHGPKSRHKNSPYFNSQSGVPKDSFNKYASERVPRDSRSQYPEEADRYRSRSAEKHQSNMDSRYPEENSQYGPRDSRSGYSEESDQQRRSRKRDPTDGLPAIPKEQMHNASRRHRDSDRRYERQRPKSEYLERHNGHSQLDNPMFNDGRQPPHEFLSAAYDRQQEQMQKSHATPQDLSPGRYSDDAHEKQAPRSPGYDDDSGMYDPFQTQRIYDPFHGYRQKPSSETKAKEPEVEYSKIIKVRRGQDNEQHPEDYPYMQMNSSRSGKHPDDYITHDRLQQSMQQDRKDLTSSLREGDNFGQYSPQTESRQREKQNPSRLEDPYAQSKYDRSQPQETEQKFVYSSQDNFNEEDPYHIRHNRDHLPTHEQYHPGYREPEDGYSTLTKYKDKSNGPQPQEPSRTEQTQLSHYDTNPDLSHHTYENIHNTRRDMMDDTPNRPPLPTAVRQQIVEEIAQAKTPHTSQEILDAERNLEVRMQQPAFFNYPTPTLPPTHSHQNPVIDPRYGKPSDSMGRQYHPHRDNYHDNRSYDQGRSRYPEGLPTRGQVEEDLRMLVQPDLNADPRSRHGGPLRPGGKQPPKSLPLIQTVKEHPDMPDSDIIETREIPDLHAKYPALSGTRLRMSISAADLIGKTHDELVLLLIQLRREFTALEKVRNYYREQVQKKRSAEIAYRKMQQDSHQLIDPRLEGQHNEYVEMKYQGEECDKKLEVYRPIVNLVHNMVNMGSLYGGDNLMLASQYRKHLLSPEQMSPPKKMIEFSRKHQEDTIVHHMKEEVDHLKRDQVDLEEKLERLYELDRLLQEQSYKVTAFQEDKDLLEKALQGLLRQQDMVQDSSHELHHLIKQQRTVEKELSRVLYHLAEASKELEETSAENNKVEHEVALLRSKVHGELARSKSAPSLVNENMRKKMTMEKDLAKVKNIMAGLSEEGQRLSEAINTLKRSSSGGALNLVNGEDKPRKKEKTGTYMETDLDTTESKDLSQVKAILSQRSLTSVPDDMNINVETAISPKSVDFIESQAPQPLESMAFNQEEGPWDISDADENTKRFYGILPKERPKTLTVRDVKRQSEQRREREKIRKEIDELDSEDPSWASSTVSPKQEYQPIYENLPPANNVPKTWSSVNIGGSSSNNSSSTPSRRTSNLHLIAPRPFVRSYPSPTAESSEILPSKSFNFSSGLSFNDSGVVKATRVIVQPGDDSKTATSPLSPSRSQPIVKGWSPVKTNLFNVKRTPKGRYMTISSSEPVKMETSLLQPASLHSVAGDLMTNNNLDMVPDIVKSSTTKVDQMDEVSFEREVLAFPNKVEIPERYMPESDEESFTEEEKYRRQEKSDRLKKILTQQSIHSLSQPDVSNVAQEKVRRAQLLTMNQELARQVTKKSREAAAARRKTWSGIPGQIIVPDTEDSIVKEAELTDMEKYQRQENLYI
ncbi:uncharacterized protein LOC127705489 isoform X8 [Mytilus californianus]|uniref:uncharacterized protein LOC127705489 isoform X8 n=1 Tax=Mytilus californianus TaxID=6549 RepID=UPI0022452835|nr:uncharacterized protein LOC127705489 isoform X8 [Mytilus californianus]